MKKIIGKLLFKLSGWQLDISIPIDNIPKCILIAAPHTSNWDYYYTKIAFWIKDIPLKYFIKDSWTRPWYGFIIEYMGSIGINRQQKNNMVDFGTELLKNADNLYLLNTPEGTRSRAEKWRTGFYHIAYKAQVPILLAYADFEKKRTGIGKVIYVNDKSQQEVFEEIQSYYKDVKGKFPENYNPKIF